MKLFNKTKKRTKVERLVWTLNNSKWQFSRELESEFQFLDLKINKLKPFNKIGFVYLQEFKPSGWMFLKDFQVLYLQRWIFLKV